MHQRFARYAAVADFVDGACTAVVKSCSARVDSVDDIADDAAFERIVWEYEVIDCSRQSPGTLMVGLKKYIGMNSSHMEAFAYLTNIG